MHFLEVFQRKISAAAGFPGEVGSIGNCIVKLTHGVASTVGSATASSPFLEHGTSRVVLCKQIEFYKTLGQMSWHLWVSRDTVDIRRKKVE
jgi:hypothetical protein